MTTNTFKTRRKALGLPLCRMAKLANIQVEELLRIEALDTSGFYCDFKPAWIDLSGAITLLAGALDIEELRHTQPDLLADPPEPPLCPLTPQGQYLFETARILNSLYAPKPDPAAILFEQEAAR